MPPAATSFPLTRITGSSGSPRPVVLRRSAVRGGRAGPVLRSRWVSGICRWWSATDGGHVGYESWPERDHVMLLDFDRRWWGSPRRRRDRHDRHRRDLVP